MSTLNELNKYLPEYIREQIEERYYAKVNAQANLEQVRRDPDFLRAPQKHVALFSDHGVVHARDVAMSILHLLDTINGVLIAPRDPYRLEFMKGYGVAMAYLHDIGMMDFSTFGRAMHGEFASQEVMTAEFDDILTAIWDQNWSNMAWRLVNLELEEPRLTLREMLAMSNCHRKSRVPTETLNDPRKLRTLMQHCLASDLRCLYLQEQVEKARRKLTEAQETGEKTRQIKDLQTKMRRAEIDLQTYRTTDDSTSAGRLKLKRFYNDFSEQAYTWLISPVPETRALVDDVIDTLRALRCADALRQRGTTLETSGHHEIFVDRSTGNTVYALRVNDDRLYLLELYDPICAGEANIASSEIDGDGNLRISFHRGSFDDPEAVQRVAQNVALVVADIQGDVIGSFRGTGGNAQGEPTRLKNAGDIQILLERVGDNPDFSVLVCEQLRAVNPVISEQVRTVPSLQYTNEHERNRYLATREPDWSLQEKQAILDRIQNSGHKIGPINPVEGFRDVKRIELTVGETLVEAGDPSGFVYIPLGEGLQVSPLGGYPDFFVSPWIPVGITGVIRGSTRNATILARQDLALLMIPADVYLKHWYHTYGLEEFVRMVSIED